MQDAIAKAVESQPKGQLRHSIMDANDQLQSADEYRELIVAWKNGAGAAGPGCHREDGAPEPLPGRLVDKRPAVLIQHPAPAD